MTATSYAYNLMIPYLLIEISEICGLQICRIPRTTRGQKLYNKTHTLPNWEGFFVFITDILEIVYYNGNYAVIYLKKTTNSAIIIVHGF